MVKKDRQSMEELWSKRFDEEAEFNEEEPLSRKAKREREKSISPILTVTLIFMALLIILPTSAYLWWSSRDGLSEEPTSPSVEQVAENNQDEEDEDAEPEIAEESEEEEETEATDSEEEDPDGDVEELAEADEETSEEPSETVSEPAGSSASANEADESGSNVEDTDSSQEEAGSSEPAGTENSTVSEPAVEEEEPVSEPAPAENVDYYTVKAGDNMYRIALNHGMSTEELMQLNGIQEETVYVGQELRVN